MPKQKIEIDLDEVERLAQVCDNEEEIAIALGISYSTLKNRKREFVQFASAIKRGKSKANAFVGGCLMNLIKEGNPAATIFYLKTRCGWKETIKQELTGADGAPIEVNAKTVENLSNEELMKIAQLNDNT